MNSFTHWGRAGWLKGRKACTAREKVRKLSPWETKLTHEIIAFQKFERFREAVKMRESENRCRWVERESRCF